MTIEDSMGVIVRISHATGTELFIAYLWLGVGVV